ncbi:MAG: PTS glucose transporter subunit IIA [Anaerorhabdus sp.]
MFNFRKKKVLECNILAPVDGNCISIESVPDKVFASKMLGDGVAFDFTGDTIYAPCDGVIIMVAVTKHAVGLVAENGVEILIHIGLDTVTLAGDGFDVLVKVNERVKVGDPLVKIDRDLMDEKKINLITPLIITNGNEVESKINEDSRVVKRGETVMIKTIKNEGK